MYLELYPLTVSDVAEQLGIRRTEVVRLRVCCGYHTGSLYMTDEQMVQMVAFAGIFSLPERVKEQFALETATGAEWLIPILRLFLEEKWIETSTIRMDNIWRGLPSSEISVLQQITHRLVRDQILKIYSSNRGQQISISASHVETVQEMLSGHFLPPSISDFLDSQR